MTQSEGPFLPPSPHSFQPETGLTVQLQSPDFHRVLLCALIHKAWSWTSVLTTAWWGKASKLEHSAGSIHTASVWEDPDASASPNCLF